MSDYEILGDFLMGYENMNGNLELDGYEFFLENLYFPFTPVQGINDDQSLE